MQCFGKRNMITKCVVELGSDLTTTQLAVISTDTTHTVYLLQTSRPVQKLYIKKNLPCDYQEVEAAGFR